MTSERSTKRMRPVLGTLCAIQAGGPNGIAEVAIEQAFAELRRIEQIMHPTLPGSDLARLAVSSGRRIAVDPSTWEVLALAKKLHGLSDGCFDPCVPNSAGTFSDVELLDGAEVLCHRHVSIDLGGIAKGYAIDRAIDALRYAGCACGLVNAGGDVSVFGDESHSIVVRVTSAEPMTLSLRNRALAVSDALASSHPPEYLGYYVRHARQRLGVNQAAVMADRAIIADALTKCALLCDNATLNDLLKLFDADLLLRA